MTAAETVARYARGLREASEDEIMAMALNSPAVHFSCFMEIRNKANQRIQPTPNILQLRMSEAYETLRDLGVKVRIIVVKPRQVGCSSFASYVLYHHGMRDPIEGISISDVKKHSAEIMDKLEEYSGADRYPWGHRMIQSSTHSLEWSNGTKWTVDSAENPDAGVGGTRQGGHFSEVAKWPQTLTRNDAKTMSAVLPSLSGEGSVVFAESTPEGAQGWLYSTYLEAVTLEQFLANWKAGIRPGEQWVKVFAAWHEFAEHSKPVTDYERDQILETLDQTEGEGMAKHGWTVEQLAWRRETIKSVCNGDPKTFAYYYPTDDVSCWLQSGTPRFDVAKLADMKHRAETIQPDRGFLVKQDTGPIVWQPMRDGSGDIEMWEHPKEGMAYLVACDPATGKSQTKSADPDATSILVLRGKYYDPDLQRTFPTRVVARVRAPFFEDDDIIGMYIDRLSRFYGRCICALEVNQGLQVLRVLKDAGVPLYKRQVENAKTKTAEEQYGFKLTDANQRRMVIDGLAAAMRTDELDIPCPHVLHQMMKFVRKPNGRAEAAAGEHDDDVMALAMAWEVIPYATVFTSRVVRDIDPPDMAKPGRRQSGWRVTNAVKRKW
jgi:hypothetical protein